MDPYNPRELTQSIKSIEKILHIKLSTDEISAYLSTLTNYHHSAYEKVVVSDKELPAIKRYLLVAQSYLEQPNVDKFFDIFRAARIIPLIGILGNIIEHVKSINGSENRLRRLSRCRTLDEFDSTLFEIAVASRYSILPGIKSLKFLDEKSDLVPDIEIERGSDKYFVECKKFNRFTDYSAKVRDDVLKRARPIIELFRQRDESAVVEIVFKIEPEKVAFEEIKAKVQLFHPTRNNYEDDKYSISVSPLPRYQSSDLVLNPSPRLYTRYGYEIGGPWMGIVPFMKAVLRGPSFVDDISWDVAVKWRIDSPEILWRYKRLGYSTIFRGLDQLEAQSGNLILHICFERDNPLGPRQEELIHFYNTLVDRRDRNFNWLVFNEIVFDIDVDGKFEFSEHAHRISGPQAMGAEPPISLIFVDEESKVEGVGEFGIGL